MDLAKRLIDRWTAQGISCPPGVSPSEIAEFESRHDVRLPADFRSYLLAVNGMGSRDTYDEDFFCFWPLSELITIAEDLPDRCSRFPDASRYFIFADHSISLPSYAIRLSADPVEANPVASLLADFGAFDVEDIFDSFSHFVSNYLDDPLGTVAALPRR